MLAWITLTCTQARAQWIVEAAPDSPSQVSMGHQIEDDLLAQATELEEARASVTRLESAVERGSTALSNGGIAFLIASPASIAVALGVRF